MLLTAQVSIPRALHVLCHAHQGVAPAQRRQGSQAARLRQDAINDDEFAVLLDVRL